MMTRRRLARTNSPLAERADPVVRRASILPVLPRGPKRDLSSRAFTAAMVSLSVPRPSASTRVPPPWNAGSRDDALDDFAAEAHAHQRVEQANAAVAAQAVGTHDRAEEIRATTTRAHAAAAVFRARASASVRVTPSMLTAPERSAYSKVARARRRPWGQPRNRLQDDAMRQQLRCAWRSRFLLRA